MGIRDAIRSFRGTVNPGEAGPPAITETAVAAIKGRLSNLDTEEEHGFFVLTQPSKLGFNVGVGFEPLASDSDRSPRSGYPVPVLISDRDLERLSGYTIDYRDDRFVSFTNVSVHVSETPNPESRKFTLNRALMSEGSAAYTRPVREEDPYLVKFLFEIPGVKALFLIGSFCTATREPGVEWQELQTEVGRRLQAYFAHGGDPLVPPPRTEKHYGEVERKIIAVLEDVVRPAVQRDGGDIAFAGYDEGTVQLYMLGSCVGCPSSMATLKMGVEKLLRESVPQVQEVVAID